MLQRTSPTLAVFRLWRNLAVSGFGGRRCQRRALSITLDHEGMRKLTDQELKAEFVSSKNQLRLVLYGGPFLVMGIAVFAVLFKDLFDWIKLR